MARHGSATGTKLLWISEASLNSTPFETQYISQKNEKENQKQFPLAAESVLQSTYMDSSMDSMVNKDEAVKLVQQLKEL